MGNVVLWQHGVFKHFTSGIVPIKFSPDLSTGYYVEGWFTTSPMLPEDMAARTTVGEHLRKVYVEVYDIQ